MIKIFKYIILLIIFFAPISIKAQGVLSYIYNDFAEVNPAGISTVNSYQLNIKGFNQLQIDQYTYNGGYLKFIAPIEKFNSGLGFHLQYFESGNSDELKDTKFGLSYSYKHYLSETSYLSVGIKGSLYTLKYKYYKYIINYQAYGETDFYSYKFNLDAGLWIQNNKLGIGLSFNNINSPEHITGQVYDYRKPNPFLYEKELNIMVNHNLSLTDIFSMNNSMIMYDAINMNELTEICVNNIFNVNKTFIFGTAWELLMNEHYRVRLFNIIGINLKDKYRLYLSYFMNEYESINYFEYLNIWDRKRQDFECSFVINL